MNRNVNLHNLVPKPTSTPTTAQSPGELVIDQALQALREAVAKVIEDHRSRGKPLALWRDGKAVWVPADKVGALHETPAPYRAKPIGSRKEANR